MAGIDVRMAGQVVAHPRWENPPVDIVTVKAVYNDKDIAFLMEWSDRFEDAVHNNDLEYQAPKAYDGYTSWEDVPRKPGNFRDSVALQFPAAMADGVKKPHFFRGDSGNAVRLWTWKSDQQGEGKNPVDEAMARGFQQPPKLDEKQVIGKGVWKDGVWRVVMKRALTTTGKNDVQFTKGKFIPIAPNAWDGSNGEQGLLMSISSGIT